MIVLQQLEIIFEGAINDPHNTVSCLVKISGIGQDLEICEVPTKNVHICMVTPENQKGPDIMSVNSPPSPHSSNGRSSSYGTLSVNSPPTSPQNCTGHSYEEFLADNIECPTCRGLGRIKKGNAELVALIPVNDKRLKPRKTFLYVLIAVIICSLIAGMLLFFLISRSITLDSEDEIISPTILQKIKGEEMIFMEYQVAVNITNENYLPVNVRSLQLSSMLYGDKQLNVSTNYTTVSVPMRSTKIHYITVNLTIGNSMDLRQIVKACLSDAPILWKLPMNFQIDANISYLSHTESSSITLYNRKVCCHLHENTTSLMPPVGLDCAAPGD